MSAYLKKTSTSWILLTWICCLDMTKNVIQPLLIHLFAWRMEVFKTSIDIRGSNIKSCYFVVWQWGNYILLTWTVLSISRVHKCDLWKNKPFLSNNGNLKNIYVTADCQLKNVMNSKFDSTTFFSPFFFDLHIWPWIALGVLRLCCNIRGFNLLLL